MDDPARHLSIIHDASSHLIECKGCGRKTEDHLTYSYTIRVNEWLDRKPTMVGHFEFRMCAMCLIQMLPAHVKEEMYGIFYNPDNFPDAA